jgi:hypothetical protein
MRKDACRLHKQARQTRIAACRLRVGAAHHN